MRPLHAAVVSGLLASTIAFGASGKPDGKNETPVVKKEIPRREVPDYDGRGGEPTTVGDVLLWVPRIALFPVRALLEIGYRQPLLLLGRNAELNNIPFIVGDFFHFGSDKQFLLLPTVFIDFGFRASFGLVFRASNFPAKDHTLSVRAATGGTDYGILRVSDDIRLGDTGLFRIFGEISRRPDFIFHAMGPMSRPQDRYRYAVRRAEVGIGAASTSFFGGTARLDLAARDIGFADGNCCNNPGVQTGVNNGVFASPNRFPGGYSSFAQQVSVAWGPRPSRPSQRAGVSFEALADHSFDFSGGGWFIYGGSMTGFFDVDRNARVFSLRVEALDSRPHGGSATPFNELPSLGGNRLPGFLDRRFIGESVFAATLEYRWPVLSLVDGVLHFGLGNVFWRGLAGFHSSMLRKSVGFGIEAIGSPSPFGLQLAFGSAPFAAGGDFNEFRLSLRFGAGFAGGVGGF